ncbi:MAG: hypothetical protein ACSHXY_03835 [Alphaproteobacteria bacterium]
MRTHTLTLGLTAAASLLMLTACATAPTSTSTADVKKPTAVDVMKSGGTYEYTKPTGPIYANSSSELAEKFVGRHVDELPETETSTKSVQNRNEVVCKEVSRTSSRLRSKKICAPRKEWDLYKSSAQNLTRSMQITRREGD